MALPYCNVVLVGNLGKDPEMRFTAGGTAICNFSIAFNEQWKDNQGHEKKQTSWFDVVLFGKAAERAGQQLSKGCQAYVIGKLRQERWDDKETGKPRSSIKIYAHLFGLLTTGDRTVEPVETDAPFPVDEDIPF